MFTIGECKVCRRSTALKDGVCADCQKKSPDIPDIFKDIFRGFYGKSTGEAKQ